jgi:hypothetical protein
MKTTEIQNAIRLINEEIKNIEKTSEAEVCSRYHVDKRGEILALIVEERATLEEEYERALEREENEENALRRIVKLSGLTLMPVDRLMLDMGF